MMITFHRYFGQSRNAGFDADPVRSVNYFSVSGWLLVALTACWLVGEMVNVDHTTTVGTDVLAFLAFFLLL